MFFTRILILQIQALPSSPGWYRDIFRLSNACVHIFIILKIHRMMYRGFKQECPNGAVNEDTFKEIYEKFFPYGSKQNLNDMPELIKKITVTQKYMNSTWIPRSDVTSYAHHVFKAFDVNSTGSISFRVPPPFSWSSVLVDTKLAP